MNERKPIDHDLRGNPIYDALDTAIRSMPVPIPGINAARCNDTEPVAPIGDAPAPSTPAPVAKRGIYVASRASIQVRPDMWKGLRLAGWPIVSTWIDESGEGETGDFTELWQRIEREIRSSSGVLLYAETDDFPLKGALIECGIAIGMGKPVAIVLPNVALHPRSMKPIGSWIKHPLVTIYQTLAEARDALLAAPPTRPDGDARDSDQVIELAVELEKQRALHIVRAVRQQGFAKSDSDLPTPAESVYDLACEEIEHRLKTEEWALVDGAPTPQDQVIADTDK